MTLQQHSTQKPPIEETAISELYGVYPDAHMIDDFGDSPAYGLWARHVKNLALINLTVIPIGSEMRPMFVLDTNVALSK
ncbi:hypothetical protein D3C73_1564650 [compost metagenome]